MTQPRPMFIVFEGIDGSGKSTQASRLAKRLGAPERCLLTAEPTSGIIGALIRRILRGEYVDGGGRAMAPCARAMALLFAADRVEHQSEITAALDAGLHVVCDRYELATITYQRALGQLRRSEIGTGNRTPDLTVYLRVPAGTAIARVMERSSRALEVYERRESLAAIAEEYETAIENRCYGRVRIVDGTGSVEEVERRVWGACRQLGLDAGTRTEES